MIKKLEKQLEFESITEQAENDTPHKCLVDCGIIAACFAVPYAGLVTIYSIKKAIEYFN